MSRADRSERVAARTQQFGIIGPRLRLAAQHELGSVADAVEAARRRNLAVGFGLLALLGATGGMIIVWSERVRSVGRLQMEFAAGISHELRTPLATIRTAAHNIAAGVVKKPDLVREYAEIVEAEGRRLSAMVDQTIQFAQTEAGRRNYSLETVRIGDVIAQAVETAVPAAEESGHRIAVRLDSILPPVLADETALRHCVMNLLTNAIKFGPADQEITIEAHHDTRTRRVLLGIHNEGPGIDVDELPNLFEPFYRGKQTSNVPGSGLGLSLVRRMVAGQNGTVTVRSEAGHGATFTLHIPVAPPDPPSPDPARVTA
jgi:signal transduction histidine kinase